MNLPTINACWIGPRLGRLHVACLRSFLKHEHRVVLHVYEEPEDVPAGIELSDADKLLPRSRMFTNVASGSIAPFSDLLRYEILRFGLGVYVDCDVYCLKPFWDADYIVAAGDQRGDCIYNGVLKLPECCPALTELCKIKDKRNFVPPWYGSKLSVKHRLKQIIKGTSGQLGYLPRTTLGPEALTYYLRKYDLLNLVLPSEVFYPISVNQCSCLFDPNFSLESVVGKRTVGLHLYNELVRRTSLEAMPEGCILDRIINETL